MAKKAETAKLLKSGDYVIYRPHVKSFMIPKDVLEGIENAIFYPSSETLWQVSRNDEGHVEIINFLGRIKIGNRFDYSRVDGALTLLANKCINTFYAESARYLSTPAMTYGNVYVLVTLKPDIKVVSGNGQKRNPYEISFM